MIRTLMRVLVPCGQIRSKLFGEQAPGGAPWVMDAEYEPVRDELSLAGLDEAALRKMDPDERVAALEQARLDPYDYIYLACG